MADITMEGKRKAAIAVMALGAETSSNLLRSLSEEQIEELTLEIASLGRVDPEEKRTVLEEFYQMAQASEFASRGGMDHARDLLEKAVGPDKALEILGRLQGSLQDIPFEFIRKADPSQIVNFIQDEHPQTIALILAHLPHQTSALVLSELSADTQGEVVRRIATMDRTAPEVIREIEKVLERRIASVFTQDFTFAGGTADVAEILNLVDRSAEKRILSNIEENEPELAEEIKKLMFVFDDLVLVDDAGIQKVLREVENKDLILALKAANQEVTDKIFRNMSERARETIKEEMEFMGPVRLRNVEEAQQKIVSVVRNLETSGDIMITGRGGGEDEIIV